MTNLNPGKHPLIFIWKWENRNHKEDKSRGTINTGSLQHSRCAVDHLWKDVFSGDTREGCGQGVSSLSHQPWFDLVEAPRAVCGYDSVLEAITPILGIQYYGTAFISLYKISYKGL